ncbi:MAG: TIGR03905 family TSCPD domain-containing protein [Bacilli bacterium]
MKKVEYIPSGVCSKKIIVESEDNIITKVQIIGGCPGNSLGVSKLCVGRNIDEIINDLKGVKCGMKSTSCPDQLTKALEELKRQ